MTQHRRSNTARQTQSGKRTLRLKNKPHRVTCLQSRDRRQATACLLTATNGPRTYLESNLLPGPSTHLLPTLPPPAAEPAEQERRLVSSSPLSRRPWSRSLEQQIRAGQLPSESAGGRPRPERDGGRARSKPRNASVAAPFGDSLRGKDVRGLSPKAVCGDRHEAVCLEALIAIC